MKLLKKSLCIVLSALLMTTVFCACSKTNKDGKESADFEVKYTYDSCYDSIDDSVVRAYENTMNAIMNGDTEVKFNIGMLDDVNALLHTGFPLIYIVKEMKVNSDNNGITITYNDDESTRKKLVDNFKSTVSSIMEDCQYGKVNKDVYVFNVYTYIATHVKYDATVITSYDTILLLKGMSASISNMFEYLIAQGGVKYYHMVGKDAADTPYFWTRVVIDDVAYNCDVTAEIDTHSGTGLSYFGMTDNEVIATGTKKDFTYCDNSKPEKANNKRFEKLRSCAAYTISGSTIQADLYSGTRTEIEL